MLTAIREICSCRGMLAIGVTTAAVQTVILANLVDLPDAFPLIGVISFREAVAFSLGAVCMYGVLKYLEEHHKNSLENESKLL